MTTQGRLAAALLELAREQLDRGLGTAPAAEVSLTTPFNNTTQTDWAEAVALWNRHARAFLAEMKRRPCPTCGGERSRALFESYDGYPFVECEACRCWFVPLIVEAEVFERFFSACPEAREVAARAFAKRSSAENVAADLERIGGYLDVLKPLLPTDGERRYLDVGCGLGHSLVAAARVGLAGVGVESSAECLEIGRRNGLDIRQAGAIPQAERFDLVSFWESLEHISDPGAVLAKAAEHLAGHGILAFTVPNQLAPAVRTQRGDCPFVNGGFDTAGHINLFSPSNLERLLARSGLELLDIDGQYGMNLAELASYLVGESRGAADLLSGRPVDSRPPLVLADVGPAIAVLERLALLSPILFGIACRADSAEHVRPKIRAFRKARAARVGALIDAAMPTVGKLEELQQRLAAAERELAETHERLIRSDEENLQIRRALKALRDPLGAVARLFRGK